MTPSQLYAINLSHFFLPPGEEPDLPNRRSQLLPFIITGYILFCIHIYVLLTQIARRNWIQRQARNGRKGMSVEFEEEVVIVRVPGEGTLLHRVGEGENVKKARLKE